MVVVYYKLMILQTQVTLPDLCGDSRGLTTHLSQTFTILLDPDATTPTTQLNIPSLSPEANLVQARARLRAAGAANLHLRVVVSKLRRLNREEIERQNEALARISKSFEQVSSAGGCLVLSPSHRIRKRRFLLLVCSTRSGNMYEVRAFSSMLIISWNTVLILALELRAIFAAWIGSSTTLTSRYKRIKHLMT